MRFFIGLLTSLVLVTIAHAQSTPLPTYTVGDTWKRSNGQELKVIKVGDNGYSLVGAIATCPTCEASVDNAGTLLAVSDPAGKPLDVTKHGFVPVGAGWKFFDFPLEPKKAWRISAQAFFRGSASPYTIDCRVVAYEDVKTKAGTFKAYRIERSWSQGTSSRTYEWNDTVWWAPAVKSSVKFTSRNPNSQEWELESYSVKE
jgi:hypothetical protein